MLTALLVEGEKTWEMPVCSAEGNSGKMQKETNRLLIDLKLSFNSLICVASLLACTWKRRAVEVLMNL